MNYDEKTLQVSLTLRDISYETEQFVNRIIEYDREKYLAVSWDNNKFIFIDNHQENISHILNHPIAEKSDVRCWGLCKVGNFDLE